VQISSSKSTYIHITYTSIHEYIVSMVGGRWCNKLAGGEHRSKGRPIIDTNSRRGRRRRGVHPYRKFIPSFGPHNTGIREKEGWDHKKKKKVEQYAYVVKNVAIASFQTKCMPSLSYSSSCCFIQIKLTVDLSRATPCIFFCICSTLLICKSFELKLWAEF
jgi:hypothetical protein